MPRQDELHVADSLGKRALDVQVHGAEGQTSGNGTAVIGNASAAV
jgi:hypothetical protein